jgi:hypothetical protein
MGLERLKLWGFKCTRKCKDMGERWVFIGSAPNVNAMKRKNIENEVRCPVSGCRKPVAKRGLFMHIFQTDDPEKEGHYPRGTVPPDVDVNDVAVTGDRQITMDYPEEQDLEEFHYLDTYTGKAYKGKRGLMIHLGQMAGQDNIPDDVTERHDPDDFPVVDIDEDGNIIDVLKGSSGSVPPLEPYLPWYDDDKIGYIRINRIRDFVEEIRESPTGAASPDVIEKKLIEDPKNG